MKEHSDKKHDFLKYEKAIINFVFSLSWNVVKYSFDDIEKRLLNEENDQWSKMPLYKRPLWWVNENAQGSYHPTIVSEKLIVLHKGELLENNLMIVAPTNKINGDKITKIHYKEIKASLRYDLRFYENGTGTCTFSIFSDSDCDIDFEKILLIQHLATTVAHLHFDENEHELLDQKHLTHSYLKITDNLKTKFNWQGDKVYLAQLFSVLLNSLEEIKDFVWDEKQVIFDSLNSSDIPKKQDWQNPYVITILQIKKEDLNKIFKEQDRLTTKEIGAIACSSVHDKIQNL